ncbi:MAG: ABC transporter permease [Thermoguttaceae bacterium]|nr:ABC transporter permease [Thermoguttaceae bacterium]MBR5414930.1 ABC transporter permease [Thermoguttaceae bacterium]
MFPAENFVMAAVPVWLRASSKIDLYAIGGMAAFAVLVWLFRAAFPKVGAIAWVTAKETVLQPLFLILSLVGIFGLLVFLFLSYHTMGEDIKIVVSQGLTLVKLLAVFLAVWSASTSIADEIEGKTALMILAKPVSRARFVIGKYTGVMIAVTLLFFILGFFFINSVGYKLVYDARELAREIPSQADCFAYIVRILPGLILAFFETIVLAAISVAISTRLSLLPNLTICLTLYALGHIVPIITASNAAAQMPLVGFFANLISVLPVLDHFNMETAVAMDRTVPLTYLLWTGLYSFLFAVAALVLSLTLFDDRDLA